jgi:hypothetical protein
MWYDGLAARATGACRFVSPVLRWERAYACSRLSGKGCLACPG